MQYQTEKQRRPTPKDPRHRRNGFYKHTLAGHTLVSNPLSKETMISIRSSRLHYIAVAFVITLLPKSMLAGSVQARQSSDFVDSIGINIHLDYGNYAPWSTVRPLITGLGVRHIRWGFLTTSSDNSELVSLYPYGIKADLVFETLTKSPHPVLDETPITSLITSMPQIAVNGINLFSGIEAVEGPNEYDINNGHAGPDWPAQLASYQAALHSAIRSNRAYDHVLILAPSMGRRVNLAKLPDMSETVDMGNAHPYNWQDIPENSAALNLYLTGSNAIFPGKPLWESENGYSIITKPGGVTEAVQAKWVPRLLLDNYRKGISRTYLYELIDEEAPGDAYDLNHHYGLMKIINGVFTRKPSYAAVRNLITILNDPGPAFPPGFISYTMSGDTSNVQVLTLEKRNNQYYLVAWLASAGAADVRQSVTFTFSSLSSATEYTPNTSTTGTGLKITNNAVTVNVPDEPVILEVK